MLVCSVRRNRSESVFGHRLYLYQVARTTNHCVEQVAPAHEPQETAGQKHFRETHGSRIVQ
jgi:hypothetical protein